MLLHYSQLKRSVLIPYPKHYIFMFLAGGIKSRTWCSQLLDPLLPSGTERSPPPILSHWRAHTSSITCFEFVSGVADAELLLSGSDDCSARLWTGKVCVVWGRGFVSPKWYTIIIINNTRRYNTSKCNLGNIFSLKKYFLVFNMRQVKQIEIISEYKYS